MNVDPQALLRTNIYKVNVYINMSIVNEKQEIYEEAFQCLKKAGQIDPDNDRVIQMKDRMEAILIGLKKGIITVDDLRNIGDFQFDNIPAEDEFNRINLEISNGNSRLEMQKKSSTRQSSRGAANSAITTKKLIRPKSRQIRNKENTAHLEGHQAILLDNQPNAEIQRPQSRIIAKNDAGKKRHQQID